MTDNVASQSAYAAFVLEGAAVSEQTAYVAIIPGTRATVSEQTAYVVLTVLPSTGRKRRTTVIVA
jgi:hypothetical protein